MAENVRPGFCIVLRREHPINFYRHHSTLYKSNWFAARIRFASDRAARSRRRAERSQDGKARTPVYKGRVCLLSERVFSNAHAVYENQNLILVQANSPVTFHACISARQICWS
jgi:hypothetical protein